MLRAESIPESSSSIVSPPSNFTIKKKLVIVGDGSSGKTCLLQAQAGLPFNEKYVPTIFENYSAPIRTGKTTVMLSLWDTAGQEDYDRLRPLSYPDTDVVIITFAVNNWESFDNIKVRWVPEIKHFLPAAPIVLVATKADLRFDRNASVKGGVRCVSSDEAMALASSLNAKYFECSAKLGNGVSEIFQCAAKHALQKSKQKNCKML